ncbi:MAG: sel1 repeat family protein, partial [Hyphomicrobiales bacterium]|nr:sel1 repeat family protein [Hyphomicrobiales bacterium]
YNLARMYLDGAGIDRNPRRAVPWLRYAAEKNHVEALAVLGNLLFVGDKGVARRRAKGLMYLTLASELAGARNQLAWVNRLYGDALRTADQTDRDMARVELKKHLRRRSRGR